MIIVKFVKQSLFIIKYLIKNLTNKIESLTSISIANGLLILRIFGSIKKYKKKYK